jgi:hypothetical protein
VSEHAGPIIWTKESSRDIEAFTLRVNAALDYLQEIQKPAIDTIAGHALQLAQEKLIEGLLWFNQAIAYRQMKK